MTHIDFHPSRLTLGTAQLGMPYGIANRIGQPDVQAAQAILDHAWARGITCFDTARAYGSAENQLGAWLAKTRKPARIVSKFRSLTDDASARETLRHDLDQTCAALGRDRIDAYLAHSAVDLDRPGVADGLVELRDEGRLGAFGASVYTPEQAMAALAVDGVGALQVPLNVFNWSFVDAGVLAACADASVAVFARSVFVQGLVFMDPTALPEHLAGAADAVSAFRTLAAEHGLAPGALALSAVLSRPEVTSVVVGAETPDQVSELADMANVVADNTIIDQAVSLARGQPQRLFDPSRWPSG